jgi:hypothetical protein
VRPLHRVALAERDVDYAPLTPAQAAAQLRCEPLKPGVVPAPVHR